MGVGNYRFYLTPENLLKQDEIPDKWGLLEVTQSRKIKKIIAPKGNIWSNWQQCESHVVSENLMMMSALRRVQLNGDLEKIFHG